jgi:hypothetical protein
VQGPIIGNELWSPLHPQYRQYRQLQNNQHQPRMSAVMTLHAGRTQLNNTPQDNQHPLIG